MKLIIPMAGMGKRLRPHTLTTAKPLLPVAGKPIVQRLVEDILTTSGQRIDEIGFVVGNFGSAVEEQLIQVAEKLGSRGRIYYQEQPLGTAHAIACAKESLDEEVIIAFADTLFRAEFQLDRSKDGCIYVKTVENPKAFGVVKLDAEGHITDFIEKPETFVSDLAIIGIYYLREGPRLKREIQYLLDNDIREKGEYQLTNALQRLKDDGARIVAGKVDAWWDCGNKDAVLDTNARVLDYLQGLGGKTRHPKVDDSLRHTSTQLVRTQVIEPCYFGANVVVEDSVIGPYVSLGDNVQVRNSVMRNTILREDTTVSYSILADCLIGRHASVTGQARVLDLGDFSRS